MEDADRVRDIAEKLARNDRNEVRLALDFEGGKSEVGEDSVPELYLTPARRQKLQQLGVIERVDTGENTTCHVGAPTARSAGVLPSF